MVPFLSDRARFGHAVLGLAAAIWTIADISALDHCLQSAGAPIQHLRIPLVAFTIAVCLRGGLRFIQVLHASAVGIRPPAGYWGRRLSREEMQHHREGPAVIRMMYVEVLATLAIGFLLTVVVLNCWSCGNGYVPALCTVSIPICALFGIWGALLVEGGYTDPTAR
jgi:hypothetical protein